MPRIFCVGHAVHDFIFSMPQLPSRGQKYRAERFDSIGGGPAATAAVAIARLGGHAWLAARLGDDDIAAVIAEELQRHGVDCTFLRRHAGCHSSVSAVVVDQRGERMIVNYTDPQMPQDAHWLPEPAAIGAAAVLADTRWPTGALRALQAARAAGVPGVLDADRPVPIDGELLRAASHVAFSADGLADLTGEPDPARGLALAAASTAAWCAVTVGEAGVLIARDGAIDTQPGFHVPVVDTLGAGDVWHGAFVLALAEGANESAACRFASAAAAVKVQRAGGRSGAPTRAEVESLLERTP